MSEASSGAQVTSPPPQTWLYISFDKNLKFHAFNVVLISVVSWFYQARQASN